LPSAALSRDPDEAVLLAGSRRRQTASRAGVAVALVLAGFLLGRFTAPGATAAPEEARAHREGPPAASPVDMPVNAQTAQAAMAVQAPPSVQAAPSPPAAPNPSTPTATTDVPPEAPAQPAGGPPSAAAAAAVAQVAPPTEADRPHWRPVAALARSPAPSHDQAADTTATALAAPASRVNPFVQAVQDDIKEDETIHKKAKVPSP
jgi:hypothetical protein